MNVRKFRILFNYILPCLTSRPTHILTQLTQCSYYSWPSNNPQAHSGPITRELGRWCLSPCRGP
jgi:hypothetical protein